MTTRWGGVTGTGVAVLIVSGGLLGLGLSLPAPSLTAVAVSAAVGLLAGWVAIGVRPRLEVERTTTAAAVEIGAGVPARLRVRNRSRLVPTSALLQERVLAAAGGESLPIPLPVLAPGRHATIDYTVPATRRGLLTLGPLEYHCADPFGLLRRRVTVGERVQVVVHPRVHPSALDPQGRTRTLDGAEWDGSPHGSVAFHSLRDYVPGDDPRSIHWRSTARRGELIVRHQVDVIVPRLTLLVDTRAASYPGLGQDPGDDGFEQVVEVVASLVAAAPGHQVKLTLATTAGLVRRIEAAADVPAVMDELATLQPDAGLGFVEVGDDLEIAPGTGLVVLTGPGSGIADGLAADSDRGVLDQVARRHERALTVSVGAWPPRHSGGPAAPTQDGGVPADWAAESARSAAGSARYATCPDAAAALGVIARWGRR